MAWNEPGNNQNPWGRRPGNETDLDKLLRDLQRKLNSVFGGGGNSGRKPGGNRLFAWLPGLLLLGWIASGFYQVEANEQGVELRFGAFSAVTLPGLHWHLPWPIERAYVVRVTEVRSYTHKTEMLTRDGNLVQTQMAVQYLIDDVKHYLFGVRNPDHTLEEVSDSAIREIIGKRELDTVLSSEGQVEIAQQTQQQTQQTLNSYQAGLRVLSVNMQQILLPEKVRAAAEDVNRAREDKERVQNEAEAYANSVVPQARGEAARRIQEAEAYRARVTAAAEGETERFTKLLTEYQKAPTVTRQRLYLETMEEVLGKMPLVLLQGEAGNMLYLPLDEFLKRRQNVVPQGNSAPTTSEAQP